MMNLKQCEVSLAILLVVPICLVQFGQDMAILTYQLHADTHLLNTFYNCVEVFPKEADDWTVVQSS